MLLALTDKFIKQDKMIVLSESLLLEWNISKENKGILQFLIAKKNTEYNVLK
jgi:hypothetical protein